MTTNRWVKGLFAAVMTAALSSGAAMAQQQKAPAPQPAPKVEQKAPAKAARKSTAKKAAPKKSTAKKRTPSECVGLSETACHANTKCAWTKEITTKKGSKRKAHCGLKPTPPKAKKK